MSTAHSPGSCRDRPATGGWRPGLRDAAAARRARHNASTAVRARGRHQPSAPPRGRGRHGEQRRRGGGQAVELVFDPSGAARISPVTPDDEDRRTYFWMNEGNPTFLTAEPAAEQGEPRFEVAFSIDGNKRLLITARDIQAGKTIYRDYPVIKLT